MLSSVLNRLKIPIIVNSILIWIFLHCLGCIASSSTYSSILVVSEVKMWTTVLKLYGISILQVKRGMVYSFKKLSPISVVKKICTIKHI
jgi:hypothetical protein